MKCSSLERGIRVVELGSKYTGSGPSTAFLRRLAKFSTSSLVVFLLWGFEDRGRLSVWFGCEYV